MSIPPDMRSLAEDYRTGANNWLVLRTALLSDLEEQFKSGSAPDSVASKANEIQIDMFSQYYADDAAIAETYLPE